MSRLNDSAKDACLFLKKFFFFYIYLFLKDRERQSTSGGRGRERGRHGIQSRLQVLSHQHRAWCRARTHEREIMTWAEVGRSTDWATQAPQELIFLVEGILWFFPFLTPDYSIETELWYPGPVIRIHLLLERFCFQLWITEIIASAHLFVSCALVLLANRLCKIKQQAYRWIHPCFQNIILL